jgi:heme ABC exporter ATP-binding subunit CcmA
LNLQVRQLSKSFGSQWALRDVSFEFGAGECVALLGPNGAGKTTLLKLLSGLLYPTHGEIEIGGDRVGRGATPARSAVGYLTPADHFYDHLTVQENLRLILALYGRAVSGEELDAAVERVGLSPQLDQLAYSLSSGMKCRLGVAKWILLGPKLLLLDEPYGPLDGSGVDLLESFVRDSVARGRTCLIATHQITRALKLTSRVLMLRRGKLVFNGDAGAAAATDGLFEDLLPRGEAWKS